jgi:hypothetical protein
MTTVRTTGINWAGSTDGPVGRSEAFHFSTTGNFLLLRYFWAENRELQNTGRKILAFSICYSAL